jgi:hypothetical protein
MLYTPGDGSVLARVHGIYTSGTKHFYSKPDPTKPTTLWLTNDGIISLEGHYVTYHELGAQPPNFRSLQEPLAG